MPVAELPRGGTPAEVKSFVVSYSPPQPNPFKSTCSITESTASTASLNPKLGAHLACTQCQIVSGQWALAAVAIRALCVSRAAHE